MKSYLQQLENNEAILLMYLAGELPDADRQEVEQMLASDSALRHELEIMRQTQQLAFDALDSLDELSRPSQAPARAHEQVSRLLGQWLAKRRDAAEQDAKAQKIPWRRISFAAAAVLLVGYYIWAVYDRLDRRPPGSDSGIVQDDGTNPESDLPYARPPRPLSNDEKVALLSNSLQETSADKSDADESEQLQKLHVEEVAAVIPTDAVGPTDDASSDSAHAVNPGATGTP
jgi:hypothetical protein